MKLWPSSLFASMSNGNTAQKGVTILQAASTRPDLASTLESFMGQSHIVTDAG